MLQGSGKAIVELGIYILVLTPIMRVAASLVLFVLKERDGLYALITPDSPDPDYRGANGAPLGQTGPE